MKTKIALTLVALLILPGFAVAQKIETASGKKQENPSATWISTLVKQMKVKDENVVRSVDRALVTMGDTALPALEKVAMAEGEMGERAKRLVEQIKNPRRGGRGERGGRGGRGERGERGGRGGRGGWGRRDPFEGLSLNDEQSKKLEAVQEAQNEERRELFEAMRNGEIDRSEIREAMTEMQEKMNSEVKKVLTEEQFKKYSENNQRGRGGFGGRGGRGGDGRGRGGDG